jgi:bifunctional non-homologous end joining protein LigD
MLSRSPAYPTGFIEPCLPTLSRTVPDGGRWAFELKHDGFRFIARRDGDRVRVFSRNARDWTDRVPLIVEAMRALPVQSATLDGEGVVVDERGVTDFERLRSALARRGGPRAAFLYGFDFLDLDGEDLRRHPWEIRRATLTGLLRKAGPGVRLSEHLDGDGAVTPARSAPRASSRRGATGLIGRGGPPTGSRSRIRTRLPRRASWNGKCVEPF